MTETKMVPLSKVKDNPWRDRVRNPIDKDRVEAIAGSIAKTKYWIGTYGRELPNGTVELAFGHHRLEAAKEQGLKAIPIILEPFTDGEMLVWMAQENVGGGMPVVIEAVYAAVRALSENKIEVDPVDPKTNKIAIRYAPSFISGKVYGPTVGPHQYTVESIAKFLGLIKKSTGKAKNSIVAAFGALETAEIAGAEGGEIGKKKATATEQSLAKLPVNEALKAVADIKQRRDIIAERTEKAKQTAAEFDAAQRKIQAARKAAEEKAEEERQEIVKKIAEAKREEDDRKAVELKEKLKAKAEEERIREERFAEKELALEVKLAENKAEEEAQRKVDEYAPVRKETDRIIHKMEQSKEALTEEVKVLSRKPLNSNDRERLRQAAIKMGEWYDEVAWMFLPPLSPKKQRKVAK